MTRQYIRRQPLAAKAAPIASEGETQTIEREPARAPAREDPRERASRRAQELRDHGALNRPQQDKFRAPHAPDGWEYEWRRVTVLNAEDPAYQVEIDGMGFEPVPVDRHPEMMPKGFKGHTITRDGMMLVERPKEISDESRDKAYREAVGQVRAMEAKNAGKRADGFDNTYNGKPIAQIKKSYGDPIKEGLSIPSD
jgi:hypothetical protein